MNAAAAGRSLGALGMAFAAACAGVVALALPYALATKLVLCLVAGCLVGVGAFVSGNLRLYLLWCLMLTVPLDLHVGFRHINHPGGEWAYKLEVSDLFLLPALGWMLWDILRDPGRRLRVSWVARYWVLLMLLGLAYMVIGPWRTVASHELLRMGKSLLLFLVVANEVVRRGQFRQVALALLAGVLLQSLVALLQFGLRTESLGLQALGEAQADATRFVAKTTLDSGLTYRPSGLMTHPNLLAVYLAMLVPIGVALLFARIPNRDKALYAATLVMAQVALISTQSRSGWVCFGLSFVLVLMLTLVHRGMRHRYLVARGAVVIGLIVIGLIFSGPIIERLYHSEYGAVRGRLEWIGDAWRMIQAKPVFGFGLNTYVFEQGPYTRFGSLEAMSDILGPWLPVVHNTYLLVWAEQGTIGLIVFLLMHVAILRIAFRNLRVADDSLFAINIGCASGIVAMMLDGMASFALRMNSTTRVFWVLAGLIVAIDYWNRRQVARTARVAPAPAAGGAAAEE